MTFYRNVVTLYILFLQLAFSLNRENLTVLPCMALPHSFSCLRNIPRCDVPQWSDPLLVGSHQSYH